MTDSLVLKPKLLYKFLTTFCLHHKWDKIFKNEPSKICGRQPLKNLKGYGLLQAGHIPSYFLKAVSHKFYLVLFIAFVKDGS